jgi:hypothetical protein
MTDALVSAEVLADTACPQTGGRVTTFLLAYPRFVHAELLTHRALSRNAASSRAVPVGKFLRQVWSDPAGFLRFGAARKGMSDGGPLPARQNRLCEGLWLAARLGPLACSWAMTRLGAHKQQANRACEPWHRMTTVVTATDWAGFYAQRAHPAALPEFAALAAAMLRAHAASVPRVVAPGGWHLPFRGDLPDGPDLVARCVARCARASYLNFLGKDDAADDRRLYGDLVREGHWSPLEHACYAAHGRHANLLGFRSHRLDAEPARPRVPFDPAAALAAAIARGCA